jgi:pimeloyl-ACP methyl ester carboxylesterase
MHLVFIPGKRSVPAVKHQFIAVDGQNIFYREAGPPSGPVILLIHGYPSSSFMYRDLIPRLSDRYHVIAPDLPGYGFSDSPDHKRYSYTFDNLARTVDLFTQAKGLHHYALCLHDFGGPVGFRLAMNHPDRVTAIIAKNACAYAEGISDPDWDLTKKVWADPSPENRETLRYILTYEITKSQYTGGVPDPRDIPPETYTLDFANFQRPGNDQIQLDLLVDFGTELTMYPKYQAYFREYQPPLLAVWGKNDPFFLPVAAEAFKRDLPSAVVRIYDAGHFPLETHTVEIASEIHQFLGRLTLTR